MRICYISPSTVTVVTTFVFFLLGCLQSTAQFFSYHAPHTPQILSGLGSHFYSFDPNGPIPLIAYLWLPIGAAVAGGVAALVITLLFNLGAKIIGGVPVVIEDNADLEK